MSALLTMASAAEFAEWERERDRLYSLSADVCDVTPEGQAQARIIFDQGAAYDRRIIETPCADVGAALAKLKWLTVAFEDGETGREQEVADQLRGFLTALGDHSQQSTDTTAERYRVIRRASCDYAHGLDPSGGVGKDPACELDDAATAMLATGPHDLAGVAVRLGYVIGNAWAHRRGDWDCPHCLHKREVVEPPTDIELCAAAEGQNGGLEALWRALASLHLNIEKGTL